jgi:hypothetical protein
MTKCRNTTDRPKIVQAAQNCEEQVRLLLAALEDVRAELQRVEEYYSAESDIDADPGAEQQMEFVRVLVQHCSRAATKGVELSGQVRRLEAQVGSYLRVQPGVPVAEDK